MRATTATSEQIAAITANTSDTVISLLVDIGQTVKKTHFRLGIVLFLTALSIATALRSCGVACCPTQEGCWFTGHYLDWACR